MHYTDLSDHEQTQPRITVREVDYDPLADSSDTQPNKPIMPGGWRRPKVLLPLIFAVFMAFGFVMTLVFLEANEPPADGDVQYVVIENQDSANANVALPSTLSPVFTDEVLFWEDQILEWSEEYGIEPNLIATVMQIESCGDPNAGSSAGAQGLFQVMPFHFTQEEQSRMTNPDLNAKRGLNYLKEGLEIADGHVGLALAGYNGGHGVILRGWASMYNETRTYYYWGTGIYEDAISGNVTSTRLNEWLAAGGANLCRQAAAAQQVLSTS